MAGLRERRRAEVLQEIRRVAGQHLTTDGPAGLSLRAVARDAGLSIAGTYRYFDSREELLTDLLVAAFNDQAEAVETAARDAEGRRRDVRRAIAAGWAAYRGWGLANPAPFGLAYGTPVPGYAAPADQTVAAGARCGDFIIGLVHRAVEEGRVDLAVTDRVRLPRDLRAQLAEIAARRGYDLPIPLLAAVFDSFVHLHGFVVMDVFGQLRPIAADADSWFTSAVDRELDTLGIRRR